jgi:hypothetical protein
VSKWLVLQCETTIASWWFRHTNWNDEELIKTFAHDREQAMGSGDGEC